ncbi:MAG: BatD family protein, partial [Bacteroidota bacterium]
MFLKTAAYRILCALVVLCTSGVMSQEVTFEMQLSKSKLGINERLRVSFSMNKDGDNFNPPTFDGFKVVMGPSQSISSSWVNGKRSFSKSYTYILRPTAKGSFTVGQATIEVDGKIYKTFPKKVQVTAAVDNPNAPKTVDDVAEESLYLVAEVSKARPYLNEAITVIYKLYVDPNVSVTNFRALDSPKYNNFWSQDIPVTKYDGKNSKFKGKTYRSVVLKRVVLYPQKSGKLDIEPYSLEVYVDVPTNRRDFFGGRIYSQSSKVVSAGKRSINVKALPEAGKPAGFTGAVGQFDFEVSTSKRSLNATESLQAAVAVRGKGNLKLFQLPEPDLPSALEVYEPEFEEKVNTTLSGMEGEVTNNYTIVPSFRGRYPIPGITFSYFDPKQEKYKTLTSDEITINVLEGPTDNTAPASSASSNGASKISITPGSQFHFIKTVPNLVPMANTAFFGSTRFYLLLLLPLIGIPLAMIYRKNKRKREGDVLGNRT